MQDMRIAAVQMAACLGDSGHNAEKMVSFVRAAASEGARLVCFPEACLTGYSAQEAQVLSISSDAVAVRRVESAAKEARVAVAFGFIEANGGGGPFVAHVVYDGVRDSRALVYRKTHLGHSELGAFTPGDDLPVGTLSDACVAIHLCWESRIPDIAGTLRGKGAELLLVPFASPIGGARRQAIWERVLGARADDNGVYVVACNALRGTIREEAASGPAEAPASAFHGAGERSHLPGGGVAVFDPKGALVAGYFGEDERMVVCDLKGSLPRDEQPEKAGMAWVSYYDRRRPELYR